MAEANSTLSFYWDLALNDPQLRAQACSKLIQNLQEFQSKFPPITNELTTLDMVKNECAPDISYALKRLIRGLSSSRDGAREGFSLALVELLRMLDFNLNFIMELIIDISKKNGSKSGQEERELLFARLFGFQAIIMSGMVKKGTMEQIQILLENLVQVMKKKDYLKDATNFVILQLLKECQDHGEEISKMIITQYLKELNQESLELVEFYLKASEITTFDGWKSELKDWKKGNVLHLKNKHLLTQVLVNSTYSTIDLHPVFDSIIKRTLMNNEKDITVLEFWLIIDQHFFNSTSHERKYIGFQIFEKILKNVELKEISMIFTQNFMRCLINSLSSKDTILNKQAKHTTKILSDYAQSNQQAALPLVMQLLGKYGHFKFDALTKTNTVETILSKLTGDGILEYCQHLIKIFNDPSLIETKF